MWQFVGHRLGCPDEGWHILQHVIRFRIKGSDTRDVTVFPSIGDAVRPNDGNRATDIVDFQLKRRQLFNLRVGVLEKM